MTQNFAAFSAAILTARKRFADHADEGLSGTPAYEILLIVFAAVERGHPISPSQVVQESGLPQGTAIRWIGELRRRALLIRIPDGTDKRRVFLHLSDKARAGIRRWIEEASVVPLL